MWSQLLSNFKYRLIKRFWFVTLPIWRRRKLWVRVLLCLAVGLVALEFDEFKSFDTRLYLRGQNGKNTDIILINISEDERKLFFQSQSPSAFADNHRPDNLYWNKNTWTQILKNILSQNPKAVAVTFLFGDNIASPQLSQEQTKLFFHPKLIWNSYLDRRGEISPPRFSNEYNDNIGVGDLQVDSDGVLRHFSSPQVPTPHIAARLSNKMDPRPSIEYVFPTKRLINFRGSAQSFQQVGLAQALSPPSPSFFKDKLILIGANNSPGDQFLTPMGLMNRNEVIAHITDNILHRRWVDHLDDEWYSLYLALLLILSLWIMGRYPSQATALFISTLFIITLAFSIWMFDSHFLWFPVFSPFIQLFFTWIVFMGLQASAVERKNWRLRREQLYLRKVEELKGNFVSLISHDLKTPIAKIQGVTDRLITQNPEHEFSEDLQSIRSYSEELHRYIRSILQVIRVESKDFRLNLQSAEINTAIETAIEKLLPLAMDKKIEIKMELEPMFSIEFDPTLIQEVILNLIENAIKYTPEQGHVTVCSREIKDKIYVDVIDTGEGINKEEQKNIWNRFVRGKEQDLKTKGTGLGLYLVKYFVELHGGQVFLQSRPQEGTKIGFWLPLESQIEIEPVKMIEEEDDL